MTKRRRPKPIVALACVCISGTVLGISGCNSKSGSSTGSSALPPTTAGGTSAATASASGGTAAGGIVAGQPDLNSICAKLPLADAQALVRTTLPAAVPDGRLGGCTFVLAGNTVADNNLTVSVDIGGDAASRYDDDVKGQFSAGGTTVSIGPGVTTPLSGVGDKAVWGSTAGYPGVSALKGDVYCSVSTADDATQLTIIGTTNNPLPQGTQAQQQQYAQLEGKLCTDLFALVH